MNRASSRDLERTIRRGAELDLSLDGIPRGRWGRSLVEQLRLRIVEGTLRPGVDMPSTRRLAHDLGVSRGVVVSVYEQLVAEGHLIAGQGSGTSVADRPVARTASPPRHIEVSLVAGMNPGQPDPGLFPRQAWQRASQQALATLPDAAFAYGDPRGHPSLRSALAGYLGRTRSILTDEHRIIVTSGFAQCLSLVVQTLARRDGRAVIAVEDPGSAGASTQLAWLGAEIVPVPVDEHGIDVARLAQTPARAVVVTPAHQYPTGVVLAPERRHALIEWAVAMDAIVVEDDYDAEYRYDREALTSLHALGPQHVIAAGSVSKSLGPAMRIGWMAAPDDLVADLAAAKANADLGTSTLLQAALAVFVDSGAMDRHLRRTRAVYRQRRDALVDGLRATSDVEVSGIAAGMHVLLGLPPSTDADHVAESAQSLGFSAQPLDRYRHRPGPPGVVLGYASLTKDAIRVATAAFVDAIRHGT